MGEASFAVMTYATPMRNALLFNDTHQGDSFPGDSSMARACARMTVEGRLVGNPGEAS